MRDKKLPSKKTFENFEVVFRIFEGNSGNMFVGKFRRPFVLAPSTELMYPIINSFSGRYSIFTHKTYGRSNRDIIRSVRLEKEEDLFILLVYNFDLRDVYKLI